MIAGELSKEEELRATLAISHLHNSVGFEPRRFREMRLACIQRGVLVQTLYHVPLPDKTELHAAVTDYMYTHVYPPGREVLTLTSDLDGR